MPRKAPSSISAASSGFQSAQYRCIAFALGNKNAAWRAPSVYDEALRLMTRSGIDVPADKLTRD